MKGSMLLYKLKLNCLIFCLRFKQLTDYIYMDIYCKLSKCIGQTLCSYIWTLSCGYYYDQTSA